MSSYLPRLAAATLLASFAGPDMPDRLRRRVDEGLGGVCRFGSNLRSIGASTSPTPARTADERAAVDAAAMPPADLVIRGAVER